MEPNTAAAETNDLHEFIDAEFTEESLCNPERARAFLDLLQGTEGVKEATISGNIAAFTYEPAVVTKCKLVELLRGAGFEVPQLETAATSPVADALQSTIMQTPPSVV